MTHRRVTRLAGGLLRLAGWLLVVGLGLLALLVGAAGSTLAAERGDILGLLVLVIAAVGVVLLSLLALGLAMLLGHEPPSYSR